MEGTYFLTGETCVRSVSAALERGVRLIDTAHIYGNEAEVGQAVRKYGVPRDKIFVITKLYLNQFASAEAAIDKALRKPDLGYIDLMLLHPPRNLRRGRIPSHGAGGGLGESTLHRP